MLDELPFTFLEETISGDSFLNACVDRRGRLWTGEHRTCDALFALGTVIGRVQCLLPRDMWHALPGGMPVYKVLADPSPTK